MTCRVFLGGLALASVTIQPLASPAQAEDRMQLGAGLGGIAAEFQVQVGDRVFFSEGSAQLGTRGNAALAAQAAWLVRHPAVMVTIEGHADEPGSARVNLEVSERRAQAVRARLIERGVPAERIRIVAFGRERLIAECVEPACAAQNRRTVTVLEAQATRTTAPRPAEVRPGTLERPSPRRLF
jgi:peptidoglycan-associated lipoprotein